MVQSRVLVLFTGALIFAVRLAGEAPLPTAQAKNLRIHVGEPAVFMIAPSANSRYVACLRDFSTVEVYSLTREAPYVVKVRTFDLDAVADHGVAAIAVGAEPPDVYGMTRSGTLEVYRPGHVSGITSRVPQVPQKLLDARFSPDASRVAVIGVRGDVWDIDVASLRAKQRRAPERVPLFSASLSPDGSAALLDYSPGIRRIWLSGQAGLVALLGGLGGSIADACVFSLHGGVFASYSVHPRGVLVMYLRANPPLTQLCDADERDGGLAVSADGKMFAVSHKRGSLELWEALDSGAHFKPDYKVDSEPHVGNMRRGALAVAFTPDRRFLLVAYGGGSVQAVRLWDSSYRAVDFPKD